MLIQHLLRMIRMPAIAGMAFAFAFCYHGEEFLVTKVVSTAPADTLRKPAEKDLVPLQQDEIVLRREVVVPRVVRVEEYFPFMDSLVAHYDSIVAYPLNEHLLVQANPWIIDTLRSFDYYLRREQGMFVYNQREMVVLRKGDTLCLPVEDEAFAIMDRLSHTLIDVNIPEFRLRIWIFDSLAYTFPVRVGRDEVKYLETVGREVNLRTPVGEGTIVRIERDPFFVNPVNGHVYNVTRRDDGRYTRMPRIPWLEPMINGLRQGALIHPTTNPETLGKAYSNGCVGTPEGDAWIVYYNAPVGTKVHFRYDLEVLNEQGDTLLLKDIYHLRKKVKK